MDQPSSGGQIEPLATERLKIEIEGLVQGFGFRPFAFRLAKSLQLTGWIQNHSVGVRLEVQGARVEGFLRALEEQKPALAYYTSIQSHSIPAIKEDQFQILESLEKGQTPQAWVLPDLATCPDCLAEISDPANRRFQYPFTNCTLCGPRFSILASLPYDRKNTSMVGFTMCPSCLAEYQDPNNRRFHAQPNACPDCGPELQLYNSKGELKTWIALEEAKNILKRGGLLAVKGIGGYMILARADLDQPIQQLRALKGRKQKPFALMVKDIQQAETLCHVNSVEKEALLSKEAPIVLLKRKVTSQVSPFVAPANPELGIMLPYSPLHHLLMEGSGPLVATSGNLKGQPLYQNFSEALQNLKGQVDGFLDHNRPILQRLDDSILKIVKGKTQILRRARGFAPLPLQMKGFTPKQMPDLIAVGGQMKGSIAICRGKEIFVSQYLGDLNHPETYACFEKTTLDLLSLFGVQPTHWVADLHPDYHSHRYAEKQAMPLIAVPHHQAHLGALLAEKGWTTTALGFAWDGTGLGEDGILRGSEAYLIDPQKKELFTNFASLHPFQLAGGEAAIHHPLRIAASLLFETFGPIVFENPEDYYLEALSQQEINFVGGMLQKGINSPTTTAMGRLFDGISAWLGICQNPEYEGQAAMELEYKVAEIIDREDYYPFGKSRNFDWRLMVKSILKDRKRGRKLEEISLKFHNSLTEWVCKLAREAGEENVMLTGGCFQNRILLETCYSRLKERGFTPIFSEQFPANDEALSLGQIYIAVQQLKQTN